MTVRWAWASIDRPIARLDESATFWAAVTGTRPSSRRGDRGEFTTLVPPEGDACIKIQSVSGPPGAHLDLEVDDVAAAARRAAGLGATPIADHGGRRVLRSPGGQPFCLHSWEGAATRPVPVRGPQGAAGRLDQVCIDAGPPVYDAEVDFWTALTGWSRRSVSRAEFTVVSAGPSMPVRLLLQRLDDDRPTSAHLDLACSDVTAVTGWHETHGARVVDRRAHWTVMQDPAGGIYCLTVRNPETGTMAVD